MYKHDVSDKHHAGNRHLAQEGGGTQSAHIANVAAHQLHAFPALLNGVKAQCAPAAHQIEYYHQCTYRGTYGTGNSCTEHAPTERKDEQVIENDIQDGSYYIAHHGKVR